MNDTISRQAAQRLFGKALTYKEQQGKLIWATAEVKQFIADLIEVLPSAQPGWIPCSERCPEKNGIYLVTIKYEDDEYDVDILEYNVFGKEWNDGELFGWTIMAWMPLPTPYREGGCNA